MRGTSSKTDRQAKGDGRCELAHRLGTAQPGISRIEKRDDLFLSTLAAYVEALDGRLEVAAVFEDDRVPLIVTPEQRDQAATVTR